MSMNQQCHLTCDDLSSIISQNQMKAIKKLSSGKILWGGTGSGKSRTSIAYYYTQECKMMSDPKPLYIITTAKKRDDEEWFDELELFKLMDGGPLIVVDSWNNISKYINVKDAFFIFDEQRLVGKGAWVKAFQYISKHNNWILLTATPGDRYQDYIPVFIANGFYRNKTEFGRRHIVYSRFTKYPSIEKYLDTEYLDGLISYLLVELPSDKHTVKHYIYKVVDYDKDLVQWINKNRKDPETNEPFKQATNLFYATRKAVNNTEYRDLAVLEILESSPKAIIFYNFDYERDRLIELCNNNNIIFSEWNGHKHQTIPNTDSWCYLVQYTAGAEGWNCITTDTIIFYSLNYSYKTTIQSIGRIDRMNTPYVDLYYYFIKTDAWIDRAIFKALREKKKFNENVFYKKLKLA